ILVSTVIVNTPDEIQVDISSSTFVSSSEEVSSFTSSEETVSSEINEVSSKAETNVVSSKPSATITQQTVTPPQINANGYKYNTNLDVADNLFVDSLVYTGYNLAKHNADGNRWIYILASQKRGLGYLSKIGYGGGSSGYETNAEGKPDIAAFERKGLVCASFVTYVYFNYLPNVAGIDTSSLTRPVKSYSAHDWYLAGLDWVNKGYSENIPFTATNGSGNLINFKSSKEIPIGSLLVFRDVKKSATYGSHVAIYAGYRNNNHWVVHVGNDNGPEFCSIERMNCGLDPHWPIAVISTPSNIRFSASIEIEAKFDNGEALKGFPIKLKNNLNGNIIDLNSTDVNGKTSKDLLSYGDYELIYNLPDGYIIDATANNVTLNTQNNSLNKVSLVFKKIKETGSKTESVSSEISSTTSK
ncbi:MAG: hypothetical protein IKT93_02920, partial [Clostridia bacterium]|nr:hypothetical protein [Clostridia bacterium]